MSLLAEKITEKDGELLSVINEIVSAFEDNPLEVEFKVVSQHSK